MPPALELIDLDSDSDDDLKLPNQPIKPQSKHGSQALIPVIQRVTVKPAKPRQYPDGPLPLRPSNNAPRKARITGRVADDDGVFYALMVGQIPIIEVKVTEILDYVSAWDLEEFENAQFIEEEENRKIAKAAEEAEAEAKRLRKLEKMRNKGIFVEERIEDSESNEEDEVAVGRHGRARPTYTHLYRLPGGGSNGSVRRRRKRDPITGELMPLSDEDGVQTMGSSDDEQVLNRASGRSEASRTSMFVTGFELPKRRRRKRDPITGELMPLDRDETSNNALVKQRHVRSRSRSVSASDVEPPARLGSITTMGMPHKSNIIRVNEQAARSSALPVLSTELAYARSSPARRLASEVHIESSKRRRRRRNPKTGELLPLEPDRLHVAAIASTPLRSGTLPVQQTEERKKRPRRRRHPITGELMPLGWVYDPVAEAAPYLATSDIPSMQELSIDRDSKRVKLNSEPRSRRDQESAGAPTSVLSRHPQNSQVIDLSDSESEDQKSSSSIQLSTDIAPAKPSAQVSSPRNGMMQRAPPSTSSSNDEPITLASFLSTTATGKADKFHDREESPEDSSSSEAEAPQDRTLSQKTSMMKPVASQDAGDFDDEAESAESDGLDEGEFFVECITAHHWSDPRTHPGLPQTMLYETKWEGWEKPTWEPAASFPDQSVVEDYRRRVGMKDSER